MTARIGSTHSTGVTGPVTLDDIAIVGDQFDAWFDSLPPTGAVLAGALTADPRQRLFLELIDELPEMAAEIAAARFAATLSGNEASDLLALQDAVKAFDREAHYALKLVDDRAIDAPVRARFKAIVDRVGDVRVKEFVARVPDNASINADTSWMELNLRLRDHETLTMHAATAKGHAKSWVPGWLILLWQARPW